MVIFKGIWSKLVIRYPLNIEINKSRDKKFTSMCDHRYHKNCRKRRRFNRERSNNSQFLGKIYYHVEWGSREKLDQIQVVLRGLDSSDIIITYYPAVVCRHQYGIEIT